MSDSPPERIEIAPGLLISRVVTGLWQIADMERDGRRLDFDRAASDLAAYAEAGLDAFDMADHYGSAEDIVGRFNRLVTNGAVTLRNGIDGQRFSPSGAPRLRLYHPDCARRRRTRAFAPADFETSTLCSSTGG